MNLTLSVDENVVARARKASQAMGKSLNQVLREYLEDLAGLSNTEETIRQLEESWAKHSGNSGGWKFNRDEIYDDITNVS